MPEPGPREVLVEITSVGVCGSDVHYYEHGRIGPHVVRAPLILGPRVGGPRRRRVGDGGHQARGRRPRDARAGRAVRALRAVPRRPLQPLPGRRLLRDAAGRRRVRELRDDPRGLRVRAARRAVRRRRRADGAAVGRHLGLPQGGRDAPATACWSPAPGRSGCWRCRSRWRSARRRSRSPTSTRRGSRSRARTGATRTLVAGRDEPSTADALIECSGHPAALAAGIEALRPAGTAVLVGMGPGDTGEVPLVADPEPRALADRHVPLRQHLPDGDRAGRDRARRPGGDHHRPLRARRRPRARCAPGCEDPGSVKVMVHP